jgi:hypothetical protein
LEHHSANQFLKAATNLNIVQPKLSRATRQDDHCFSDCTVSVIQIFGDVDVAFRISGAELRTVLSATTMLADKPHRLNGRTSVQRVYVLTILPPVTVLTVGLPAQRVIAQRFRALAHLRHHPSGTPAMRMPSRIQVYAGNPLSEKARMASHSA